MSFDKFMHKAYIFASLPDKPMSIRVVRKKRIMNRRFIVLKTLIVKKLGLLLLGGLLMLTAPGMDSVATAAGDGQPFHFGFKKSRNGELPSIAQEGFMDKLQEQGAVFLGDTSHKELYLTFDNGYENGYTGKVLDILKQHKVPAAFFVTGHFVRDQPELLRRMADEGHIIGNHSWSHPDMTTLSAEQIRTELDKVRETAGKITGQSEMKYVRPPRGIFSGKVLKVCQEAGYTNVFWSAAYKDWDVQRQMGSNHAFRQVVSQLHPGAVLLLHSVSKDNMEALASIIQAARQQGYTFKSLDELQHKTYR